MARRRRHRSTISSGEFAELKADLHWTRYGTFRVSIDRVDQGRVAVIDGMAKDSNGHLRCRSMRAPSAPATTWSPSRA